MPATLRDVRRSVRNSGTTVDKIILLTVFAKFEIFIGNLLGGAGVLMLENIKRHQWHGGGRSRAGRYEGRNGGDDAGVVGGCAARAQL